MESLLNALADSILAKPFASCSTQSLEQLCREYPYATALQLLYARRLQAIDSDQYEAQWQKTLLLVNNPLLINHLFQAPPPAALPAANLTNDVGTATAPILPADSVEVPAATVIEVKTATPEDKHDPEPDQPDSGLQASEAAEMPPLPAFRLETIDPAAAELSFTPYHTIDYFAAQGIKLGAENPGNDHFGNQLKSFTEWLKHMKRLPGTVQKNALSAKDEQNIEKMAAASLAGENADTEAMARVWIKQGNKQKALDIYKKLSLQNPAKSAYFAAKIDHLKNSI
ncbi:hypothetical protein GCM10027051_25880 [Niabella terrae]